jgi:hypothetical protein
LGGLTNQYAAMPSLHVGWALWCGIMLWRYGRNPLVRALGVLYPLGTALVVMGTANHYLLDAVAGAAVMAIGYALARPALRLVDDMVDAVRLRRGAGSVSGSGSVVVATSRDVHPAERGAGLAPPPSTKR